MKERLHSVQELVENAIKRGSDRLGREILQGDEESNILKCQFCGVIAAFMEKLNQTEQQLEIVVQRNRKCEGELEYIEQELERLKLLLPVKDQLLRKEQHHVDKLSQKIKNLEEEMSNKLLSKMLNNKSKKRLDESSFIECESLSQFCLDDPEPNKNRGRSTQKDHNSDLKIAKLKNENKKLENVVQMISAQLELIHIENQHLKKECQLTNKRQKHLTSFVEKMLQKKGKQNCVQSWNQRCESIQQFVDDFSQKYKNPAKHKKIAISQAMTEPLHPPTPHFSNIANCFGKKAKYSTTTQAIFPQQDEISLGQLAPSIPDSCPPSI